MNSSYSWEKFRFMTKVVLKALASFVADGRVQNVKFQFLEGSKASGITQNIPNILYRL